MVGIHLLIHDLDDLRGALRPDGQGRTPRGDVVAVRALLAVRQRAAPHDGARTRRYWLYAGAAVGAAAVGGAAAWWGGARRCRWRAARRHPVGAAMDWRWTAAPCPWKACVGAPPW